MTGQRPLGPFYARDERAGRPTLPRGLPPIPPPPRQAWWLARTPKDAAWLVLTVVGAAVGVAVLVLLVNLIVITGGVAVAMVRYMAGLL